jgi:dipeptidyl aminopeptidase/acylaminoacyl peptidase
MVLYVHGGPNARDSWGLDNVHQWLTNRGYAVLSVNYRGSTGFGKSFINAGNGEWSAKMHDDLIDAVNWAVKEGVADKDRVAIMGGSYGGYATLVGLAFTPDTFVCGVDIVGPSNLLTLVNSLPEYWKPLLESFKLKLGGDPKTKEGIEILKAKSPLFYADNITKPLLVGQGANDPRVKRAESDQIVEKMRSHGIPVIYALYPDEGHGFARPENKLSFFAITEGFLAKYLNGNYESINDDFKDSSIKIEYGEEYLPHKIKH